MRLALVLLAAAVLLLAGCREAPAGNAGGWITKEEALKIAKSHLDAKETVWSAEMLRDQELEGTDGKKELRTVWKVEGKLPMGNKEVYTIDASDGRILAMMEAEAPHVGEGSAAPSASPSAKPAADVPLRIEVVEKKGSVHFKLPEEKGVNTAVMQSMVPPGGEGPVTHLVRRVSDESGLQRYRLDAVSVNPDTKSFKIFPLADLRVKDGYSVDTVAMFYGYGPDPGQLVFIKPSAGEQEGGVRYRIVTLNARTGQQTVLAEGVPPDLSPDFLASGWMTRDGGKLVLNAFKGGKLWIADLKEQSVKALDGSFNHNWPLADIWSSPDGDRFWYGRDSLQLFNLEGKALVSLPEEPGYRNHPAVAWSPDGAYGVMEYTLDRGEEHVLVSEDVVLVAPQGLKMLDRNGKLLWQKTAGVFTKPRMEWSGWLADGGMGVLHEYKLERPEKQGARKAESSYWLVVPGTGETRELRRAGSLEELKKPAAVTGRDTGRLLVADAELGLYWTAGEEYGAVGGQVRHARHLPGAALGRLVWLESDHAGGTAVLKGYDPAAGKIAELRLEEADRGFERVVCGKWVLGSEMEYLLLE